MSVAALALVLLAPAAGAAPAPGGPVPVEAFARMELYHSVKISPNGEYVALDTVENGQRVLAVMSLKTRKLSGAIDFPRGQSVADYWWVGPARVVASVAIGQGELDQPRLTGELFAMNADGSAKSYLFGFRGERKTGSRLGGAEPLQASAHMLDPLPHDPAHALIGVVPWGRGADAGTPLIETIDVMTGVLHTVAALPLYAPFNVVADANGKPRYAVGYDGAGHMQQLVRDTPEAEWRSAAPLAPLTGAAQLFGVVGGASVFLASNEKSDRSCVREYRFQDHSLATVSCSDVVDAEAAEFMGEGRAPAAVRFEDGVPHDVYLEASGEDARLMKLLDNSFGGQRVHVTSTTLDGSKLVLLVDSDRNPGDFYLFDRSTRKAAYMLSRREWIDPEAMAPMQPVTFKTRDGATVFGYLTLPRGSAQKKLPLVLIPHGGPHGYRDYWEWDARVQLLASRGYAVLQVNFRGSGGYGRAYEEAGYHKWGTLMQDDLADGVRWAVAQGIADPARLCIYGGSYGGYAALMSATREPDLYKCAVGHAGIYDLKSQSADSDIADSRLGRNYLERVLGSDPALLLEQSPVAHVARLKAHVLIAHGTADTRVPFSQARLLRDAMKKAGKPFEWAEYEGEEHGFYKDENRAAFYGTLLDFLDRNIGSGAPAAANP